MGIVPSIYIQSHTFVHKHVIVFLFGYVCDTQFTWILFQVFWNLRKLEQVRKYITSSSFPTHIASFPWHCHFCSSFPLCPLYCPNPYVLVSWVAIIKRQSIDLKLRNVLSHSSRNQKWQIKVSAVPWSCSVLSRTFSWHFQLLNISTNPCPLYYRSLLFSVSVNSQRVSLLMSLHQNFFSYKKIGHILY